MTGSTLPASAWSSGRFSAPVGVPCTFAGVTTQHYKSSWSPSLEDLPKPACGACCCRQQEESKEQSWDPGLGQPLLNAQNRDKDKPGGGEDGPGGAHTRASEVALVQVLDALNHVGRPSTP